MVPVGAFLAPARRGQARRKERYEHIAFGSEQLDQLEHFVAFLEQVTAIRIQALGRGGEHEIGEVARLELGVSRQQRAFRAVTMARLYPLLEPALQLRRIVRSGKRIARTPRR